MHMAIQDYVIHDLKSLTDVTSHHNYEKKPQTILFKSETKFVLLNYAQRNDVSSHNSRHCWHGS